MTIPAWAYAGLELIDASGTATGTVGFSASITGVTEGDLIVLSGFTNIASPPSITDDQGNEYTVISANSDPSFGYAAILGWARANADSSPTVTLKCANGGPVTFGIGLQAFSGGPDAPVIDDQQGSTGTTGTTGLGPTLDTSGASDLLLSMAVVDGSGGVTSPWLEATAVSSSPCGYQLNVGPGSYPVNDTDTRTGNWVVVAVALGSDPAKINVQALTIRVGDSIGGEPGVVTVARQIGDKMFVQFSDGHTRTYAVERHVGH